MATKKVVKKAAPKKSASGKTVAKKATKKVVKKAAPKSAAKSTIKVSQKKTAIVTGACGFAGSHMVDLLVEKDYNVIATDLENAPREWVNPSAKFMPADITDPKSLEPLFAKKVDVIYHPAAVFDYEAPWELCERVNVGGTKNLSELALRKGVKRLQLFSTVSVYGHPEPDELPVREDNPMRPGTNYERSKLMQEEVGLEYLEKGLEMSIVRPTPVYGPRNMYGVATILFLLAKFPILPFPVNMDGYMVGVHIRDVVQAALFLEDKEEAIGQAFNLADNSRYTLREFVEFVCPLMGVHILPVFIPQELLFRAADHLADASKSVSKVMGTRPFVEKDMVYYLKAIYTFSNEKLRKLGYEFEYPDMLEGAKETIEWYKENGYLDRRDLWHKALFGKTRV